MTTIAMPSSLASIPDPSNVWQFEEYISKSFIVTSINHKMNMSVHQVIKSKIRGEFYFIVTLHLLLCST